MPLTEPPTIRRLSSRDANKDARSAFNQNALFVAPLPDGTFALCDRGQNFYLIVPDPPDRETFILYHRLLNTSRLSAEAKFLGEPSTRDLARDIKQNHQTKTQIPTIDLFSVELDL